MQDARHKYLITRLVDAFSLTEAKFSALTVDAVFDDETNLKIVNKFLKGEGPPRLYFFFQEGEVLEEGEKLFLTYDRALAAKKRAVYVLRQTGNKPVSTKEVDCIQEVLVGVLTPDVLHHFEVMLNEVFLPLFGHSKQWGKCSEKESVEFTTSIHRFLETLTDLMEQTPKCIELRKPEKTLVDQIQSNYSKAASDTKLLAQLEGLMETWIAQCEGLVEEKEDYASAEPQNIPEEIGPLTELEYWKTRYSKFESVTEQLRTPESKTVIAVLTNARSRHLKRWKQVDAQLTDGINEAKDNVKYLTTLEKYIDPLYNSNPDGIIEVLPGFINNIKMMYSIARYYSQPERMTTLFIKITNQMIVNCKNTIRQDQRVWDQALEKKMLPELLKNLKSCIRLNAAYQEEYRKAKENLAQNPKGKQFDFNTLHIFGKFELFCKRIQKLVEVFTTIEQFTSLSEHNIDGMDSLIARFFEIVDDLKRKASDLLDYTKPAFDKDYIEFNKNIQELESSLQVFINSSFENITSTVNALALLKKFQSILKRENLKNDLESKYMVIFHNYGLDLENVQKTYERHKQNPPTVRNWPPIASNITWSRQLLRRIEEPMNKFQQNKTIMSNQKESKKIIKSYNKVARALVEFEQIWLNAWKQSIASAKAGLQATLIVRSEGKLYVNFDIEIFQLIREAKCLLRMGVEIPQSAKMVLMQADKFKQFYNELQYALREYDRVVGSINHITRPLMSHLIAGLDTLIRPGETSLTWQSLNIDAYLAKLHRGIGRLEDVVVKVNGIIDNRMQSNLKLISNTLLVHLPENQSFSLDQFVRLQESHIQQQSQFIDIKNVEVEKAANDVIQTILAPQLPDPNQSGAGDTSSTSGPATVSASQLAAQHQQQPPPEVAPEEIQKLKQHFNRLMFKAILTTTTKSLNLIKKRVGTRNRKGFMFVDKPFFDVSVELHPPHVMLNPSLEEVQNSINRSATAVLRCSKYIKQWDGIGSVSFFDEIAKNKEIVKVVLLLTGGIHGLKKQVIDYLNSFKRYEYLWMQNKEDAYKLFLEGHPTLEDFENELKKYMNVEQEINSITSSYTIGSLCLETASLKAALKREANEWKAQYAKNLHMQARKDLEKIMFEMEENEKLLQQEITDNLQDLRVLMDTLKEIRERESEIELTFGPVESMYQLLAKYNVSVAKDEFDRVSDLRFKWKKLRSLANERNDQISQLQGGFKRDLTAQVMRFSHEVTAFRKDFEQHGPMAEGIRPQEAMERLKKYQRLYDDKERKWDTYMAGEELFGLPQHDYPELRKTQKELGLLEKLYTLYINVIQKVNGYAELLWSELDFQAITDEVMQFQNQCRKLPKSLRDWEAYLELKKTIDDFLELQPVLELLNNPAVRERHWKDIMKITGVTWRLDADLFKLGNLLEAKLLNYKEDVEDIALSSVKEADIETKKNGIAAEWEDKELVFGEFKHRGPIILKGEDTNAIKEMLEESQLQLGSMLASRYVAPFREEVNGWMVKLTMVSETISLWMEVQATWMYLEAVFAGGDIMKQLPQEAKRFAMIDKQWVKIMAKAFEMKNVVGFCYGNELLSGLPYLRDQLDECQRKLTAYLEQKRGLFPRFFFVSDGVLLEILSQSSDPQAIQPHLVSIFDGLASVVFEKAKATDKTPAGLRIVTMISPEGEEVKVAQPVMAIGNVEEWLNKLCTEMCYTMKEVVREAATKIPELSNNVGQLRPFIEYYPAQVSLLGLQLLWTHDVQDAISSAKGEAKKAIQECGKRITGIRLDLTDQTKMDLSALRRTNIETLISIQVHQQEEVGPDREARARPGQLRVAEAGPLLLEVGARHVHHLHRRRGHGVLLRVPGRQGAAGRHPAHRQVLHHAVPSAGDVHGRSARRPRRYGKDRDRQGFGPDVRQVRRRVQLLRPARLPGDGQDLQGPGAVGCVGLLRRVQPHRPPRAVGGGAAGGHHPDRAEAAQVGVHLHRRPALPPPVHHGLLHHHEPRVRGAPGAPREPEDPVPRRVHDGAGPARHHEGEAGLRRVQGERAAVQEVLPLVRALRAAAQQAAALRLRSPQHPLRPAHGRRSPAERHHQGRGVPLHAHPARHEPVQARVRGRGPVPVAHLRHVRRQVQRAGAVRPAGGGDREARRVDEADPPRRVGGQGAAAVRDEARAPRHHGGGARGGGQVQHPERDAGLPERRGAAPQGLPHEPQGHHGAPDVREAGPRVQRLARRHLLLPVAQGEP
eukprot:TRINITY_DN280_c0_g1_i7.p1 TRINITY_DN280_c0_g1~~TRINITY_DN280_c0_g1_i7.p1  ORF type:complete len:2218 (+),score=554.82 TRINITY_DN280_c0_g1_i7:76-6729(+)